MRVSFNTWAYCSFPVWLPARSLEDTIDTVAALGYDGIELGAAAPHAFPPYLDAARRRAIRKRLEHHGLEVAALLPALGGAPGYNPVSPDEPERDASRRHYRDLVQLASDLGCPTVIWLTGYRRFGQSHEEAWALAVDGLRAAAHAARESGVRLAVEPTPADSNVIEHAGDALALLDDAGLDAGVGGVMLDTYHVLHRRDDLREAFALAGDRLVHVHVADLQRDPPGTHTSFHSLVAQLRADGYDGWLSMEIGFDRRERDPDGLAAGGLAYLRGVIDAVGATA